MMTTNNKQQTTLVDIAFCFDVNQFIQAMVAITSLLCNANKTTRYKLYLVCPKGMYRTEFIEYLNSLSYDFEYKILDVNLELFNKGYCGKNAYWSKAIFYRLQLPNLLPDVKKIIYADSDIIFLDDLAVLTSIDINGKLVLGVKDTATLKEEIPKRKIPIHVSYICSGFIVMNLELMRELNLVYKWNILSLNKYYFPDQDIINITCEGKIGFLPPKYNSYLPMSHNFVQKMMDEQIWTKEEVNEMLYKPVVYHFVGWEKPWQSRRENKIMDILWWKYAKITPYFGILNQDYITNHMRYESNRFSVLFNRKIKLFDKIPIIFLKRRGNRWVWYLFKIFPLWSIKVD
ncbi:MAG: glycosyltransferase family 8 protein [Endomicrobium sp.]|jgi:lipopolysaccharide biosynthesis glycosyltransferase|nr:glycosyltransferase family 8 protein [Endomicrobium sp.]